MKMLGIMRECSNLKTSREKAITLIALVITIIVLLILAGITVATLTGENGLLSKAQLAKEKNIEAEQDEKDKLSSYENEIENNIESSRNISDSDIRKIISESCVGFPDYANRTELTSGIEYTADNNMYIIMDTTSISGNGHVLVTLIVNGQSYRFDSQYEGADYGHHSESIIPIKKGDVYTITFRGCKAYKVLMRY